MIKEITTIILTCNLLFSNSIFVSNLEKNNYTLDNYREVLNIEHIVFVNQIFYSRQDKTRKLNGVCMFDTNTIKVRTDIKDWQGTLWHEVGHFIDNRKELSELEEFKHLYKNYKNKYKKDSYYISSKSEFFAEEFSKYITEDNYYIEYRELNTYFNNIIKELFKDYESS